MFLRFYQDTPGRNTMVIELAQIGTNLFTQCSAVFKIESQVNRCRYLVDVLTACTLRANRGKFDVSQGDLKVVSYVDGFYHLSHTGTTLSGSGENPPGRDHLLSG